MSILFYIFAVVAVFAALMVITRRNPVISALYLLLCLFSLAMIYALLNAHFIALLQVLVYMGGIMVLIIFVIMIMNLRREDLRGGGVTAIKFVGLILSGILGIEMIRVFVKIEPAAMKTVDTGIGSVEAIAKKLFTDFLLPFEVVSVLLLVAMVGAIVLAIRKSEKSEVRRDEGQETIASLGREMNDE